MDTYIIGAQQINVNDKMIQVHKKHREPKTKFTVRDAANLVRALDNCSNPYYIAYKTEIPLSKVLQVRETLRIKRS